MHQLREARMNELAELTELCLQSKALWGYDEVFMLRCREALTFHPADSENSLICVAQKNNTLLGCAQLQFNKDVAFLERLFVSPTNIKNGIGKALFGWSLKAAHRAGVECLLIDADPLAAGFYLRMGAREAGIVDSGTVPGQRIPRFKVHLSCHHSP
ncbi:GNAT family N-acetyltransferase [Biostraticola tofi]|uniref:Acetyltransferase (GNAT) family protein n=1 Tax=Biostraticola tofi TaxID=466109 RepID=A0A4R3Z1G4_9GAMM|nr:GNAT family N-acetyltransferase [Biostraticola tofi]TCV98068.1 acetyltransferase (GNAT) family protein [Biostraticola tofi]